jgi:hypothetical protein
MLKMFGKKKWILENILKPNFSGKKSYNRVIRKLWQLKLIEKIGKNDMAVKSI